MGPGHAQRVVVTGVGTLSAIGVGGLADLGAALDAGLSGLGPVRQFPLNGSPSRLAGEIPEGALDGLVQGDEGRRLSRVCRLTLAAARLALRDGGWDTADPPGDLGIVVGSELGDMRSTEELTLGYIQRGPLGISAMLFPNTVMNTMAAITAIAVQARGPSVTVNQPTVGGELAIARAAAMVAAGRIAAALAGGVDELSPAVFHVLRELGALSPRDGGPEGCFPFDRRHNGTVRGEGATFVLLESLDAALRRGAPVHAEIRGAAWVTHLAGRDRLPAGRARDAAAGRALALARLAPEGVGWTCLAGTGDPELDEWELALVRSAFARHRPVLTSVTPLVGDHAGAGALRVAAAAWTAATRRLPSLASLREAVCEDCVFAVGDHPWTVGGPGLVHGAARGGTQVSLVVAPLEAPIP